MRPQHQRNKATVMQLDYHTFISFLKDSNVEKEFRENFFNCNGGQTLCRKVWDEEELPLQLVFRTLLDWDSTPEGPAFWQKIDNQFQRKFC